LTISVDGDAKVCAPDLARLIEAWDGMGRERRRACLEIAGVVREQVG